MFTRSAGHLLVAVASHLTLQSLATLSCDRPMTYCMPHGVPDAMTIAGAPVQDLADARRHGSSVRGIPQLPADSHRMDGRCRLIRTPRGSVRSCLAHRYADAAFVEPAAFLEARGLDDEGVAFPPTNRVAIPLLWTWPPPVMAIAVAKSPPNRLFRFKGSLTGAGAAPDPGHRLHRMLH